MVKLPQYHVLSFLHDKDFGCALTALVDGAWYHVIADPKRFNDRSKRGKQVSRDYRRLLGEVKAAEGAEDGERTAPLFVQEDEALSDTEESERDSAIDVSTPTEEKDTEEDEHEGTPGRSLERWMLKPLAETFSQRKSKKEAKRSVQEWYHAEKYYFDLCCKDGKLRAEEDTSPTEYLQKRVDYLVPAMPLPKYIQKLDIPMINAKDLTVLSESSEPTPIHPARVRNPDGQEYFLKLVDPNQHQPTKREIEVMKRIESKGLQNEIRVPLLRGLVHFSDASKNHIMGFVMDSIEEPRPLTTLIDSDVDEVKRLAWAEESARMVDVLHQNGIVWGDAKGDNFMVDKNDELWIIDFGGSYTEGWVDPELKETEEGDKMGVRKICNGLTDPENNTVESGEEEEAPTEIDDKEVKDDEDDDEYIERLESEQKIAEAKKSGQSPEEVEKGETSQRGSKRKADDAEEGNEESPSRKQQKTDDTNDQKEETQEYADEPLYCYCNKPATGRMVGCDAEDCKKQWFHFECVGIEEAPEEKTWYCKDCK